MKRAEVFHFTPRTQEALVTVLQRVADECRVGQRVLLEHGVFEIDVTTCPEGLPPEAVLYLGDNASLIVRDGLAPYVRLTLPESYLRQLDEDRSGPRRLYWSSSVPPLNLDDPTQNPQGLGDVTLYVPEALEAGYGWAREGGLRGGGYPPRYSLSVWEGRESSEAGAGPAEEEQEEAEREVGPAEAVHAPSHYTWLGQALSELGLGDAANVEAWDVLDAAFPSDPMLWNCGKYLLRQGRKGGDEKRLEDLRKARQYLNRAIERLEHEYK